MVWSLRNKPVLTQHYTKTTLKEWLRRLVVPDLWNSCFPMMCLGFRTLFLSNHAIQSTEGTLEGPNHSDHLPAIINK